MAVWAVCVNFGFGGFCAYCCSEGGVDCVTVLCGHGGCLVCWFMVCFEA